MDSSFVDVMKLILQYGLAPLGAFLFWTYKKQHQRVDKLETRVATVEQSTAVIKVMIDNIRDNIKEIKVGIDKLIDRGNH